MKDREFYEGTLDKTIQSHPYWRYRKMNILTTFSKLQVQLLTTVKLNESSDPLITLKLILYFLRKDWSHPFEPLKFLILITSAISHAFSRVIVLKSVFFSIFFTKLLKCGFINLFIQLKLTFFGFVSCFSVLAITTSRPSKISYAWVFLIANSLVCSYHYAFLSHTSMSFCFSLGVRNLCALLSVLYY